MILETERLLLRPWNESDVKVFIKMNADPRVMEFFPNLNTPEQTQVQATKIIEHFEKFGFGLFATERKSDSRFIGFVGLQNIPFESRFTPAVEVGWRLAFDYWNQGYATEAAREVLKDGFERVRLYEILAMTTVQNVRSQNVMKKLGMTYDPTADFEHPKIPAGNPVRPHILYRLKSPLL